MTANIQSLFKLDYGGKIEREIARLTSAFDEMQFDTGRYSKRWLALKLLEGDADILKRLIKYGIPGSMQFCLDIFAFTFFIFIK